jgi:hypothetical protein
MALFRRAVLYSPSLSHPIKLACVSSFSTQVSASVVPKPIETPVAPVIDPNIIKLSIASHPYDIKKKTSPPLDIQESSYFAIIGLLGKQFKLTKVLSFLCVFPFFDKCLLFFVERCFCNR